MKRGLNLDGTPRTVCYNLDGTQKPPSYLLNGGVKVEGRYPSVDGDYVDELSNLDGSPSFRQNGYELVFYSANSDDLIVPNNTSWATWEDVNYEFTTDVSMVQNTNNLISFGDSVGNKFRLTRWSTGGFRGQLTIGSVTNDVQISWDDSWKVINIRQTSGIIYVNNVLALDFSARNAESLFSFNDFHFGSLSYSPIWYTNQTLYNAVIDNETFNPSDINSSGEIVGSSGTVSTVSTSHASGLTYILGTVFQKSNFGLAFDSANSEDLVYPNSTSWSTWGDVNWEITTDVSNIGNSQNIFSFGDGAGDKFRLTRWSTGTFRGQLTIGGVTGDVQISWDVAWTTITIKQENGIIYVNNVQALDFSARNAESLFSFNDFYFGRLSYTPIWYTNQTLFDVNLDGVNYPLTEGLGNTTGGGIISTSHADGIDRINYGMWLKGNDIDGWMPYVK